MGRSQETFGKKDNEKKRLKKRMEKEEKRDEKQDGGTHGQPTAPTAQESGLVHYFAATLASAGSSVKVPRKSPTLSR